MNISPVDLLIRVALATEGASEIPAGTNHGPYVERVLAGVGLKPGDPWCAAQATDWGVKALRELWPLPKTGGCVVLAEFAAKHNILVETPEVGDIGLIWEHALGRFGHALLVLDLNHLTISGNTIKPAEPGKPAAGGSNREGWLVAKRTWPFTPQDRFVRWTKLLT